jgi:hypothetical protein
VPLPCRVVFEGDAATYSPKRMLYRHVGHTVWLHNGELLCQARSLAATSSGALASEFRPAHVLKCEHDVLHMCSYFNASSALARSCSMQPCAWWHLGVARHVHDICRTCMTAACMLLAPSGKCASTQTTHVRSLLVQEVGAIEKSEADHSLDKYIAAIENLAGTIERKRSGGDPVDAQRDAKAAQSAGAYSGMRCKARDHLDPCMPSGLSTCFCPTTRTARLLGSASRQTQSASACVLAVQEPACKALRTAAPPPRIRSSVR